MSREHMLNSIDTHYIQNGLKIGFVPQKNDGYICVHIRGLAGSNYETPNNIGTAHLLEHVIMASDSVKSINQSGAKLIAICSRDDVIYSVKTFRNKLKVVTPFIISLLTGQISLPNYIEDIKQNVALEIFRQEANPEKTLTKSIYKILYPHNRISFPNTGTTAQVSQLDTGKLAEFYNKRYVPNNFVITVTGDISQDTKKMILAAAESISGDETAQSEHTKYMPLEQTPAAKKQFIERASFPGCLVKIDYYGKTVIDINKYPLTVAIKALDSHFKKDFNNTSIYKMNFTNFSTGSYGIVDLTMGTTSKNHKSLINAVINFIRAYVPTEFELEMAKQELISSLLLNIEKLTSLTDYYSELMLHGDRFQNMEFEVSAIRNCSSQDIIEQITNIRGQPPKITVLS